MTSSTVGARTDRPSPRGVRGSPERRAREGLRGAVALLDVFVLFLSVLVAYLVRSRVGELGVLPAFSPEGWLLLSVPFVMLLCLHRMGCYRHEYLNATADAFRRFAAGIALGVVVIGFLSFLLHLDLSRSFVLTIGATAYVVGGVARLGLRRYIARRFADGRLRQRLLIVGYDQEAAEVARAIDQSPRSGYEVAGFLTDPTPGSPPPEKAGRPVLGTVSDLDDVLRDHDVGIVLVAPTAVTAGTLQRLMERLEGSDVGLAVAPSLFQVVTRRVAVESVANVPLLHVDRIELDRSKAFLKRGLDLVVAVVLGTATLPIWLVAALAIKLHDRGPVLFRQIRVGREGQPFMLLKFRTMVVDAEERLAELVHLNEAGEGLFKIRDDPRVTRPGRFLRTWSIDELPQLWNVIRGDMSMVGPRPPLPSEVESYRAWHHRRLRIRPGITGMWQTSGRSDVSFDEAVRLDLFYIENWSLSHDLFLLAKTVWTVLQRRGAY